MCIKEKHDWFRPKLWTVQGDLLLGGKVFVSVMAWSVVSYLLAIQRVSGSNPTQGIFVGFIICLCKINVCIEK